MYLSSPMMRIARNSQREAQPSLVGVVTAPAGLPVATGVELSFGDAYQRVHDRAIDHASHFIGYDAACDALHEAASELWSRWTMLRLEQRTPSFFLAAVHLRVVDQLRRERRYVELTEELEESPEFIERVTGVSPETGEIDLTQLIDRIVASMPMRCREVFVLVREQHFSYADVASTLGIAVSTAQKHMTRAKEFMRKGLLQGGIGISKGTVTRLLSPRTSEALHD